MLPNTQHFIQLQKTRHPHGRLPSRMPTELITPVASVNINGFTAFKIHNSHGISRQNAVYLGGDKSITDGEDQRNIRTVLDALHARYPALDYSQYENRLREQGIHYLVIASMFDADFYVASVGMAPGAAHLFQRWVVEELSREPCGRWRSRDGRENISEGCVDDNENIDL
jgi:hypothetical protein